MTTTEMMDNDNIMENGGYRMAATLLESRRIRGTGKYVLMDLVVSSP